MLKEFLEKYLECEFNDIMYRQFLRDSIALLKSDSIQNFIDDKNKKILSDNIGELNGLLNGEYTSLSKQVNSIIREFSIIAQKDNSTSYVNVSNLLETVGYLKDLIFDKNTGNLISLENGRVTTKIPVEPGKYKVYPNVNSNLIAKYDINGKYIGVIKKVASTDNVQIIELEDNVAFIRINYMLSDLPTAYFYKEGDPSLTIDTKKVASPQMAFSANQFIDNKALSCSFFNKFQDETVVIAGDSLIALDQVQAPWDSSYTCVGIVTHIKNELNCNVINLGMSGAKMISGVTKSIHANVKAADLTKAKYLILEGGSNDSDGSTIGTIGSRQDTTFDTTTYIGALRDLIHYAYSQNHFIKIYLIAPSQMDTVEDQSDWGKWLPYCDAMEQVANMYGIPILRMDKYFQDNAFNGEWKFADKVHWLNETAEQNAKEIIIPFLLTH